MGDMDMFKRDPNWKRQHTISLRASMWRELEREMNEAGFSSVGELSRAIIRCWIEGRKMPIRHLAPEHQAARQAATAADKPKAGAEQTGPRPPRTAPVDPIAARVMASGRRTVTVVETTPVQTTPDDPDFDSEARALRSRGEDVPF